MSQSKTNRRVFLQAATGAAALMMIPSKHGTEKHKSVPDQPFVIKPLIGYSLQIGLLLSMLEMVRYQTMQTVQYLTIEQLDWQPDERAYSIGVLLLHLAATEKFYQLHTFQGKEWGDWKKSVKRKWDIAGQLNDEARKQIRGNDINHYLLQLEEIRADTRKAFAAQTDAWLMETTPFFDNQPTNNYAKWCHIGQHESSHHGQMQWIIDRLPN